MHRHNRRWLKLTVFGIIAQVIGAGLLSFVDEFAECSHAVGLLVGGGDASLFHVRFFRLFFAVFAELLIQVVVFYTFL